MAARSVLTGSRVVWVTSGVDGTEHAVTEEQLSTGRTGVYVARCGVQVVAASMVSPALRRCADCLLPLRVERARHRAEHLRGGPLVRWMRRLLGIQRLRRSQDSPYPDGGDTPLLRPSGSHGGAGEPVPAQPGLAVTHRNRAGSAS